MAKQLDLQEQEQIDALKAFWNRYGNLITWVATLILAGFAAYNGWNAYQRNQALQASTMYGEVEAAARAGDANRAAQIFGDMKARQPAFVPSALYTPPAYTQQAGLLAAKAQADKGQTANAIATLQWVIANGNPENASVARLRLAGVLADQKKYDEALQQLAAVKPEAFAAIVSDRRGDILLAQGKREEAKTAYRAAWSAMPATLQYRVLVDAKLTALGASPAASAAVSAASEAAR
jgi:predicted negative regulator of RcsB-dependent stress response